MESDGANANEATKMFSSIDYYSTTDQQSLPCIMEDYFTSRDDQNEDLLHENGSGKRYYNVL